MCSCRTRAHTVSNVCERDLVIKRQGDPTFGNVHLCKIHTLTAHHNTKISFSTAGCCVNDGE